MGATATPTATATPSPTPTDAPTGSPVTLEEIVVRRPRSQAAGDPTASATVVEASRFAGEAKTVADLVATAPGVAVNDYGGLGHYATVSIRGSMSSGVLVLLDGLPLDGGSALGTDLASIPRHWVSRVEVVRGAEGAHYGAGALAGVVNVITARPEAGAWSAETGYGSFGSASAAVDGALTAGPWTLFAAGSADGTDGDFTYLFNQRGSYVGNPSITLRRLNNGALRGGLLLKASRPLGDWQLDLMAQGSGGRRDLPGSLSNLTSDDWQRDDRALLSARLVGPGPAQGLGLGLRLHARLDDLELRVGAPGITVQRGAGGGVEGEATLDHPAGQARLAVAISGETLRAEGLGLARSRATLSLSLSDDLALLAGRLRVAPALRAEEVGPFAGFSAKLGASLALGGPLSVRASVGRSFRPPAFTELYLTQALVSPNPALAPEVGVGGDAALVHDGPLGLFSLGGFAQVYRDLILYEKTSSNTAKPFNAGKALVSGLEAELATPPAPALLGASGSASYTLLVTRNLRGVAAELGRELPWRARHRLFARAGIAPGPVGIHVEFQYVGRQFEDAANSMAIAAVPLWNVGAALRLAERPALRLAVEVRNLADARTLRDSLDNPLPGRLVMVTLRAGASAREGEP
jgi:iron complex outermembrane receptor protein